MRVILAQGPYIISPVSFQFNGWSTWGSSYLSFSRHFAALFLLKSCGFVAHCATRAKNIVGCVRLPLCMHTAFAYIGAVSRTPHDIFLHGLRSAVIASGWSPGLVARHGRQAWSPGLVARPGRQAWSPCMVARHGSAQHTPGRQAWSPCLVARPGRKAWSPGLVARSGRQVWSPGLVARPGRQAWSPGLEAWRPGEFDFANGQKVLPKEHCFWKWFKIFAQVTCWCETAPMYAKAVNNSKDVLNENGISKTRPTYL